jgi:alpha-N-arabinofuranosidase
VLDHQNIKHDDLEARNTLTKPETVVPRKASGALIEDEKLKLSLPALSYTMLRVGV